MTHEQLRNYVLRGAMATGVALVGVGISEAVHSRADTRVSTPTPIHQPYGGNRTSFETPTPNPKGLADRSSNAHEAVGSQTTQASETGKELHTISGQHEAVNPAPRPTTTPIPMINCETYTVEGHGGLQATWYAEVTKCDDTIVNIKSVPSPTLSR